MFHKPVNTNQADNGAMVVIFGKPGCPYTQNAVDRYRELGVDYEYFDVKKDRVALERMLRFSGGRRCVPVIVDDGDVTVGFGGT
jgi:glutaredoxin 3